MTTRHREGQEEPGGETSSLTKLSATTLAQYVRLESCDRYLWYRLHPDETRDLFRTWRVTEQPLTPLLTQKGAVHETTVTDELAAGGGRSRAREGSKSARAVRPN